MTSNSSEIALYLVTILSGIAFFASVAVVVRMKDHHTRKMALMGMMMSAAPATLAPAVLASMKDRQNKPPWDDWLSRSWRDEDGWGYEYDDWRDEDDRECDRLKVETLYDVIGNVLGNLQEITTKQEDFQLRLSPQDYDQYVRNYLEQDVNTARRRPWTPWTRPHRSTPIRFLIPS
jgi:hypothetical protein